MVFWRCLITSGFITFFTFGCGDIANSSAENTKQIVQESNVTRAVDRSKD